MLLSEPMVTVLTAMILLSLLLPLSWPCTKPTFAVHILENAELGTKSVEALKR
jgi:hypothetical protein